ncbi:MAG: hypothetical protein II951_04805 [Bacteroidales bacterium]|nr:hypothetical protein [Bacteroidales bacterium]
MKKLVLTFAIAVAIVASAVVYSSLSKEVTTNAEFAEAKWSEAIEARLASLAEETDVVDDLVFDNNGHVVMSATYCWSGESKNGMDKKVFDYDDNGNLKSVTSYAWSGNDWKKEATRNIK